MSFVKISDDYDQASIEKLENFLLSCQKEIADGKLWVALQANALSDQSDASDGFTERFKVMMSNLDDIFHIPKLSKNMRNVENINLASQGVQERNLMYYRIADTIEKLPPQKTLSFQEKPTLIPVHADIFGSNFRNMLGENILNRNKKTLILHTCNFLGTELKSLLIENFPEIKPDTILHHDNYPNNATKKDLQNFLKSPEIKIGIFQQRYVTGMEGSNVVYFHDANHISSVRCAMTRAVSQLRIILRFTEDEYPTTFHFMKINHKFIECQRILYKYDSYYDCLLCNTKQICTSCLIGCHHEHPIEHGGYVHDKSKCDCFNSQCLIKTE